MSGNISLTSLRNTSKTVDRFETFNDIGMVQFKSREGAVQEIRRLWRNANQHFVSIGRWLNAAKMALPEGEFEEMVEHDLPFSPSVSRQLRGAADFVDSGRIPQTQLPDSYSTVYQISTLNEKELVQAQASGKIRPDLTRDELINWKREHVAPKVNRKPSLTKLYAKRRALLDELLKLRKQIQACKDGR
jgi:hypothetical protein